MEHRHHDDAHNYYQEYMRNQQQRILHNKARTVRKFIITFLIVLAAGVVLMICAAAIIIFITSGISNIPNWVETLLTLLIMSMLLAGLGPGLLLSDYFIGPVADYTYQCPHPNCGQIINLYSNWECGWCGNINRMRFTWSHSALEDCNHPACTRKKACAIRCPHCERDTVFDPDVYERSGGIGVAKLC